jgi:antitoxin component of MazEF toxin-antitoxin module
MTTTITKIGKSNVLVFDTTLMDLAGLKVGDRVNVEIHQGGTITITPLNPLIAPKKAQRTAKRLIKKNAELFRRLS